MLATPEQYRAMIAAARSQGHALPALNVTSSQTLNAAIRGLVDARSDGIVQVTTGAAEYWSGAAGDLELGAVAFARLARVLVRDVPVLVALHTDHCPPEHVDAFLRPLLERSRRRRARGRGPLFNSHMFDGSSLPLDENLRISAGLLAELRELEIVLELEIGTVGGEEDGLDNTGVARERLYSTPDDARAVVAALGEDDDHGYLLAATFGNVHGSYAPGHVQLRPELLGELQRAVTRTPSSRGFDFVFHGGSGSSADEIAAAIANGVVKFNVDTDLQYAFTHAIEEHFESAPAEAGGGVDKRRYDPRGWGRKAEQAMAARVVEACEQLGSSGRTLAFPG